MLWSEAPVRQYKPISRALQSEVLTGRDSARSSPLQASCSCSPGRCGRAQGVDEGRQDLGYCSAAKPYGWRATLGRISFGLKPLVCED
jgi:hypothetical protein